MGNLVAQDLVERVFLSPDARARDLRHVDITALDPFLRILLFTDGTVTRSLEVQTLSRVSVEVIDQSPSLTPAAPASFLDIRTAEESIRRRAVLRIDSFPSSMIYAESYLATSRLPEDFITALAGNPNGIGGTLDQMQLASRRELLWFGLGSAADRAPGRSQEDVLVRQYRVIVGGHPAILISESFVVALSSGVYRLAGLDADRCA